MRAGQRIAVAGRFASGTRLGVRYVDGGRQRLATFAPGQIAQRYGQSGATVLRFSLAGGPHLGPLAPID